MRNFGLSLAALLLAGCAGEPRLIPQPVMIEGPPRLVPLPAELLEDCPPAAPVPDGATGGELLKGYKAAERRLKCRDSQIEQIRRRQPPAVNETDR